LKKEDLTNILLGIAGIMIIATVVLVSGDEETLEIPDLDEKLCPISAELAGESHAIFFDFSDPLPEKYLQYPQSMLNKILETEVSRFDNVSMYTFNPNGAVPREISNFCIPITLQDFPEEDRRAIWGRDPDPKALDKLPQRYARHLPTIKKFLEFNQGLETSIAGSVAALAKEGRKEQPYSLLIENIDELAKRLRESGSQTAEITIFSDMLQNTHDYSHYSDNWDFSSYLQSRPELRVDMAGFKYKIHYLQHCETYGVDNRATHEKFWQDYFEYSNARVEFNFLERSDLNCAPAQLRSKNSESKIKSGPDQVRVTPTTKPASKEVKKKTSSETLSALKSEPDLVLKKCDKPVKLGKKNPIYPRRAKGDADVMLIIGLDSSGRVTSQELKEVNAKYSRHGKKFVKAAIAFVKKLRFKHPKDTSACQLVDSMTMKIRF
jgi:hypothetical protein